MGVIVGAYPLLPRKSASDEIELYELLESCGGVNGLELPWTGSIAGRDPAWLVKYLPPAWTSVVTSIPDTMAKVARNRFFGLASRNEEGRQSALEQARAIYGAVTSINDAAGRLAIGGIELHSAPGGGEVASSAEALRRSIVEITSWEWGNTRILMEHVDAHSDVVTPAKGFLSLESEIEIAQDLDVGLVLNWARSAIELRSADRVVEHVVLTRDAGVLEGLFFSGVADDWIDCHLPFREECGVRGDPESLLTQERARSVMAVSGNVEVLGLKMRPAKDSASMQECAKLVTETVRLLDTFVVRTR